jgi:hypothetical protein
MAEIARVVTRRGLHERDDSTAYWRSRPVHERIAMVEELRREFYGWPDVLNRDFSEFVECCVAHDSRFPVVGDTKLPLTDTSGSQGISTFGRCHLR